MLSSLYSMLAHRKTLPLSFYSSLIDRCLLLHSLPLAECLHALHLKLGLHRDTFLANRLLTLYSRINSTPDATRKFFEEVPTKNVFTYNILLASLARCGRVDDACRLFDGMPERDVVSWNSMISGYACAGLVENAFEFLYRMREHGVRLSGFTYSIVASCISCARRAKEMHASAMRTDVGSSSTVLGNSLINMYGRIGLVGCAWKVFQAMQDPDVISWNSVISMCGHAGLGDHVMECFRWMNDRGFLPDEFTLSTMINVCTDLRELAKEWRTRFGSFKK